MNGDYAIQTLMFNMSKKIQQLEDDSHAKTKMIHKGDMFGEVALLYGCRRTSTVMSMQYSSCAFLRYEQFQTICQGHPIFKKYLKQQILSNYDDELRIFLVTCLQQIDYLKGLDEDILIHISMNMVANDASKNAYLINAVDPDKKKDIFADENDIKGDDDYYGDGEEQIGSNLVIIYDGKLVTFTDIDDKSIEFPVAYMEKGTILNAHNFLVGAESEVSVRCLTAVTYYYLSYQQLRKLAKVHDKLRRRLRRARAQAMSEVFADTRKLDYQETNYNVATKINVPRGLNLTQKELERVPHLKFAMKNAALYYLTQLRKIAKDKPFNLVKATEELKKQLDQKKEKAKKIKQELDSLVGEKAKWKIANTLQRAFYLKNTVDVRGFEKLKNTARALGESTLVEQKLTLNQLKHRLEKKLLPSLDEENDDLFEFEPQGRR